MQQKTYVRDNTRYVGKVVAYGKNHLTNQPIQAKWVIAQSGMKAAEKPPTWESDVLPYSQLDLAMWQAEKKFLACTTPVKAGLFEEVQP
jgi:hypothetical protein